MKEINEDLEMVKRKGSYLMYVKEQTPEICMAAVKQDPEAVRFVNEEFKHLFKS